MKLAIGTDHRGLEQIEIIEKLAASLGHDTENLGATTPESCDYPDVAAKVAGAVAAGSAERGILICGTGIGMSIAANKVCGIRAAVCSTLGNAILSRQHNNANVLCVPGDSFNADTLTEMVTAWLATEFEGGRHQRRLTKVAEMEARFGK